MISSLERGIQSLMRPSVQNEAVPPTSAAPTTKAVESILDGYSPFLGGVVGAEQAKRLSAVYACVEIISNSMGKLPMHVIDRKNRQTLYDHPLEWMLNVRPNDAMTPTVAKKMLEANVLCAGNGVAWIMRDSAMRPTGYLPIPSGLLSIYRDASGRVQYHIVLPSGEPIVLTRADVIHIMGPTRNGYSGMSVLSYASEVTAAALAAQSYNKNYYLNGGQPSGVLQTDSDLTTFVDREDENGNKIKVNLKDELRKDWERIHSGPTNAQRLAILDFGLKYEPIAISNRDAQFVEQYKVSVEDIARFFNMPLYKLAAGKQSYNSNEQNAIEYITETLHPIVTQWEEEWMYKTLTDTALRRGLAIEIDMTEELRGDLTARSSYYERMRNIGVFSVNDVCRRERLPDVPGGDERRESLNYVPLRLWPELSVERAKNKTSDKGGSK